MIAARTRDYYLGLVRELRKLPNETEWVEFKRNNSNPKEIGEYISALSNSAALCGKAFAYMVWGIEDETHDLIGTDFKPERAKKGNEELENWLLRQLSPKIHFEFTTIPYDDAKVVLLEIGCAFRHPVQFDKQEYIRVGSYKKKLKDYPEKERELWKVFDQTPFEKQVAEENLSPEDVLTLINYPAFFDLLTRPLPETKSGILQSLAQENVIQKSENGQWSITNLGGILFAKRLSAFQRLKRKTVRVIEYSGTSRIQTQQEQEGNYGYAVGFEGLIGYINSRLPSNEIIEKALRKTAPMYPELAIRELVANAIIHQDFQISGSGPLIELFQDRMEITNPGKPLVDPQRFLDSPPRSRNEALASLMRRIGVCEERGSGIDKVVFETEFYQLPAPTFETMQESTRATLFAHRSLKAMDKKDKIHACYLHACLKYVNQEYMTNSSLRDRFGFGEKDRAAASKIIKDTQEKKLIRLHDPTETRRNAKYIPFWA